MTKNVNQNFIDLLKSLKSSTQSDTNVAQIAKVTAYNIGNQTADVKPLVDDTGGKDEAAIISDCPVLRSALLKVSGDKVAYDSLTPGDQVLIVFNDRNLDNYDKSGAYKKDDERMHDINDAVVVGVIA